MPDSTLEAPPSRAGAGVGHDRMRGARTRASWRLVRAHPGWATAAGFLAVAVVIVALTPTRPSYDAYGWLVWGYQSVHLHLDLGGAPSWKPLPFLFTVPYALFGSAQVTLWMITNVAVSLAGALFAGRIAYRLVSDVRGAPPSGGSRSAPFTASSNAVARGDARRAAALAAAVFAAAAVLGIEDYAHYILSFQSDPMIVTCCLGAIDCYLSGRYRWAFVLGLLASLGRPEAWPFLGLYSIWAWRRVPAMRWLLCAGVLVIAFLWFGIPTITNGRPFVAGQLALGSPRELRHNKVTGTIGRFTELEYLPVWIAALLAVALALLRRNRAVLMLAAGAAGWVVVEIGFALHGWAALSRYMFEAGAVGAVLAAIGIGWVLAETARLRAGVLRWTGVAVVAVLVAALIPGALARVRTERTDLRRERVRTDQIAFLQTAVEALGGYRLVRYCGEPVTRTEFASVLAWVNKLDVGFVGNLPHSEMRHHYPIVVFTPLRQGGWSVVPWHARPATRAQCRPLLAEYVVTPRHPSGELVRGRRPAHIG